MCEIKLLATMALVSKNTNDPNDKGMVTIIVHPCNMMPIICLKDEELCMYT